MFNEYGNDLRFNHNSIKFALVTAHRSYTEMEKKLLKGHQILGAPLGHINDMPPAVINEAKRLIEMRQLPRIPHARGTSRICWIVTIDSTNVAVLEEEYVTSQCILKTAPLPNTLFFS
jgi:hypothetical protein